MDHSDFQTLIVKLHGFYGDRFLTLAPDMARFWFESLRYQDADTADMALHRWARQFTWKPPSLDELLEQMEYVQEERRASERRSAKPKTWLGALQDAADVQAANPVRSEDDASYGRLMVILAERSIEPWADSKGQIHPKLTEAQRGEQCLLWARRFAMTRPQLAADLQMAATHFGVAMAVAQSVMPNGQEVV
jgi:hypothetical protein